MGKFLCPNYFQNDYFGITRGTLTADQASVIAISINALTQTETQYVNGLLSQVTDTTIPAVAVEATMYGVTGTSAEITSLITNLVLPQVANATSHGLNPQVYACEGRSAWRLLLLTKLAVWRFPKTLAR